MKFILAYGSRGIEVHNGEEGMVCCWEQGDSPQWRGMAQHSVFLAAVQIVGAIIFIENERTGAKQWVCFPRA